jgi:hypothetical protein
MFQQWVPFYQLTGGAAASPIGLLFIVAFRWAHAGDAVALTGLAVLLLAIRNAWDLVTWLAPRRAP